MKNDPKRATGRTLGLALQAIGKAVENPGTEVEFINHNPQSHAQHHMCKRQIELLVETLHLVVSVDVRLKDNWNDFGLYVKSNWISPYIQRTPVEEAFKRVYGRYPDVYDNDSGRWVIFQQGFEAAHK